MNNLQFNKSSLKLLRDSKQENLNKLLEESNTAMNEAARILAVPDIEMLKNWITPVLEKVESSEELLRLFKMFIFYHINKDKIAELEKEVSALDLLLDESGPLALATVSFEDMEIYEPRRN